MKIEFAGGQGTGLVTVKIREDYPGGYEWGGTVEEVMSNSEALGVFEQALSDLRQLLTEDVPSV